MMSPWRIAVAALALSAHVAAADIRETAPENDGGTVVENFSSERTYWGDMGYGSLSVITNVFYMPVKVAYAIVGLPVGGLAYVLTAGDTEVSDRVWGSALGGDYVITPDKLLGHEPIYFNGRP